jgi:hypothetical protein
MGVIEEVKPAEVLALLAEAAYKHPKDSWVPLAKQLVPDLADYYTSPCPGVFMPATSCREFHVHTLWCFDPRAKCLKCGKTNAEHRTFRY